MSIVSGLQAIESSDPTRRYRQLIRDLALAHEQGDAMQTGDPTLEVLSQAYANFYAIEAELGALSAEMKDAFDESTGFMRREVVFPFWGMNPAFCGLSDLLRWLRGEVASGAGESGVEAAWGPDEAYYTFYCAHAPTASQQAAPGTRSPSTTGAGTATPSRDIAALPNFERFETAMDVEARRLLADGIIPFLPGQEPPLARLAKSIGDALMPYSRWLLPSLYGSLGALVYHMRLIVDPLRPNPRPSRLLHYVALGGLAGVILTWLLTPGSLFADRVAVLGLNLFVVAFLFGYNLDSFFSTLDRYVALSADASRRPPSARVAATLSSDRTGSQQQTPPAAT